MTERPGRFSPEKREANLCHFGNGPECVYAHVKAAADQCLGKVTGSLSGNLRAARTA
jgi:hypothetical protein